MVYFLYRLLRPRPYVIINQAGIRDNGSLIGAGLPRWEEIAQIGVHEFMGQRMLFIMPTDPEAVIRRQVFYKRATMRINAGLVGAPINIPAGSLTMPIDELLNRIHDYVKQESSRKTWEHLDVERN